MVIRQLVLSACVLALQCRDLSAQYSALNDLAYRLERQPTYLILAPRRIYPDQVVQVSVSILKLYHEHINVRASIRSGGHELTSFYEKFTLESTRILQMLMPENAQPGNYTLKVEGSLNGGKIGNIFENETDIIFDMKQASIIIQTDKPLYMQGQTVKFRIVPMKPNLMPAQGSLDVYIQDPSETTVRRWLARQTNAGVLSMKMELSDQPKYGTWNIRVHAFGTNYYQTFMVEEFFRPRFFVNVSMPAFMMEDSFGLAGLITGNHTSGEPVKGNGNVRLEIRPPLSKQEENIDLGKNVQYPFIQRNVSYFIGRNDFLFTMRDIKEAIGYQDNQDFEDQELHVTARIRDWQLDIEQTGFAVCVVYQRKVSLKLLGDKSRTFKPGFPVNIYYAVMHEDGTPLAGHRRQVTITRTGGLQVQTKHIVRDDGIVKYSFVAPTDKSVAKIKVQAYYDTSTSVFEEVKLHKVYSKTGAYIHVETSTERAEADKYMVFTVRTSLLADFVNYLIVAAGNIVVGNTLEMLSMQKTFSVALSRDMVPSARILVYLVSDGEVVADVLNFFVNGSNLNPVEVRMNMGKDFSRDTVEMSGRTEPGSFIAFSGIDSQVYQYGGINFIREDQLIEELETYDSHSNYSFSHKWYLGNERYQKVYFPASSYGIDTNTTFLFSGLVTLTDANVSRLIHYCNETMGFLPCHDGSCYSIDKRCDRVEQCDDGADEMGCKVAKHDMKRFTPMFQRFKHVTRHFEETADWMWREHYTKPDGRIDLHLQVPKEPMSWIVSAFSMSRDKGFGITSHPVRYQSTRPFYTRVETPSHARRGEQIGVRIVLFNYWQVNLECLVMLHSSDDYQFVVVDDFGVVSSYAPKLSRGNIQTMVYVEARQSKTIYMPIIPNWNKDVVEVTVSATSFMARDVTKRLIHIRMDGVTNFYTTPYLVDLINQGSQMVPDFDIPIPEYFVLPEQRRHMYVPGSQAAHLHIVGDAVGTAFFKPRLNSENMMHIPYGGGEQALFNFGANLYYLKYLKITNQLQKDMTYTALDYMNLLLQRLLSYMSDDGAFSMFRDYQNATPSIWVTAQVLRTLQDGDEADWRDTLFIPSTLLNKITTWLVSQQRRDGSFVELSPVYDTKLANNFNKDKEGLLDVNVTITAHVLIALSNSNGITGIASNQLEEAKARAIGYAEGFVNQLKDPYQTALIAYALAVSNSNKRNNALQLLNDMKRSNEFTYWSSRNIPKNPDEIVNTVPYQKARLVWPTEGSAVEATSYALLAYLKSNRKRESLQMMKWLQTVRNSVGGFSSTRDTIMAIQALTEYARGDTNRHLYNIQVSVAFTSVTNTTFRNTITLDRSNWMNMQTVSVPSKWVYGQVKTTVIGTGMALMMLDTRVNVEYADKQKPSPQNGTYFNVYHERLHLHGRNFSIIEYTTCTRWTRPEIAQRTGLVALEVEIPTGYVIMNDALRHYVQSGIIPGLRRGFFYDQKVVFYLDYLDHGETVCVQYRADRWFPSANVSIQHKLKVYDFYEPGMHNTTLYNMFSLFQLHICQVCGSYQCPYCPNYNVATLAQLHPIFIIFVIISTILIL